jgi:hypothetical protein
MASSGLPERAFPGCCHVVPRKRLISKANECETKAKEAFDPGVKQYFVKLARDYRHLAELQGRTRAEAEGGERGIRKRPAAASVRGTVKRKRV